MKHVVFVDSTVSGLLAFEASKRLGHHTTFILPSDASFLAISVNGDRSKFEHALRSVDTFIEVGSLDGEEFSRALQDLNSERPIDALITTSEAAIVPVAREAEVLGTIYPSFEALTRTVYKDRLRRTLREANLRSPDFEVVEESAFLDGPRPRIPLPYVIKPTRGFAKQFSSICFAEDDYEAFSRLIAESRRGANRMIDQLVSRTYLVEEYVKGTLHSAEVIVQAGRVSCYATTVRFRSVYSELLEMTATMPSGLDARERQEIKDYVQAIFDALGLRSGLYHVELLRDERGPCLVEINARMMGSVAPQMYRMLTGVDPFEMLIRIHLGEHISIDDSLLTSAASVVTVAARHGGRISTSYRPEKLDQLLSEFAIEFCTVDVLPGQEVNVYTGNIGTIGHVIVKGSDPHAAARRGNEFLARLDELFGLELAKYF